MHERKYFYARIMSSFNHFPEIPGLLKRKSSLKFALIIEEMIIIYPGNYMFLNAIFCYDTIYNIRIR